MSDCFPTSRGVIAITRNALGAGRPRTVVTAAGDEVAFAYDPLRRRVKKTARGETTAWIWDGDVLLHELRQREGDAGTHADAAPETTTWIFDPDRFAPAARLDAEGALSVVTDHLGTPLCLLDEHGAARWQGSLDAWGTASVAGDAALCPWRFPGQYEDAETGLYYNRFRYYDAGVGGYLSLDPIGLHGGSARPTMTPATQLLERLRSIRRTGYGNELPGPHDATFMELARAYDTASAQQRAEIRSAVTDDMRMLLLGFGDRLATVADRAQDPELVWRAFVAHSIEDFRHDDRENTFRLAVLHHVARKLGLDTSALTERAAMMSSTRSAACFRDFEARAPALKSIASMGITERWTAAGVTYGLDQEPLR